MEIVLIIFASIVVCGILSISPILFFKAIFSKDNEVTNVYMTNAFFIGIFTWLPAFFGLWNFLKN